MRTHDRTRPPMPTLIPVEVVDRVAPAELAWRVVVVRRRTAVPPVPAIARMRRLLIVHLELGEAGRHQVCR